MGEYAIRKSDGQRVKIGTCEMLYWLRYEDRYKVTDFPGTMLHRYWRLPFPEEDGHEVCSDRAFEPWRENWRSMIESSIFEDKEAVEAFEARQGIVQTHVNELGMLINLKCFHGLRLPATTDELKAFWNGKRNPLRVAYVKNTATEMKIVIACKACETKWSCSFNDVERHLASHEMRLRLLKLCQEYWWEVHCDSEYSGYKMVDTFERNGKMSTIILSTDPETHDWFVSRNDVLVANGDFSECSAIYLACLHGDSFPADKDEHGDTSSNDETQTAD